MSARCTDREVLAELASLVLVETGEDKEGNLPHHPREALVILREAAQKALAACQQQREADERYRAAIGRAYGNQI